MIKKIGVIIVIVFFSFVSKAQIEQLQQYQRLFTVADSFNRAHYTFSSDSSLLTRAHSLDQLHPSGFFDAAIQLLVEARYYDAAFFYYLGKFRFIYYNAINPHYQASGDGALFSSLSYIVGEPIDFFLKTNSNNFILVIKEVQHYCVSTQGKKNYFKKDNFNEIYEGLLSQYSKMAEDIQQHQQTFEPIWKMERNLMEEYICTEIQKYQNLTPEQRAELKSN
jgi:hypothetical protein